MTATSNPFSLITEPTAVQRILLAEGLLDLANEIEGDGFAFVPIECRDYWGLVVASKEPDGAVSHRVVTCRKEAGPRRMAEKFAEVIDGLASRSNYGVHCKVETVNRN